MNTHHLIGLLLALSVLALVFGLFGWAADYLERRRPHDALPEPDDIRNRRARLLREWREKRDRLTVEDTINGN